MAQTQTDIADTLKDFGSTQPMPLTLDLSRPPVRAAYAAAHIVMNKNETDLSSDSPKPVEERIDWEATLAYRRYLWRLGFGVAEAMDTAQRNQIGWKAASILIDLTLQDARERRDKIAWPEVMAGAGADGLEVAEPSMSQIIDEMIRQGEFVQSRSGSVILLATPYLPAMGATEDEYVEVYSKVAQSLKGPLFIHWLGEMFAPNLAGYFPGRSFERIMESNADRIRGVKISLLDQKKEIDIRNTLRANGQIVLTGDDYHYPELILGDGAIEGEPHIEINGQKFPTGDFSHALLGIFDAIAPVAAKALNELSAGNRDEYKRLMESTQPLARLIFEPPTQFYKAGVVFLAWLNGRQERFAMLGNMERERSRKHYIEVFRLAADCGVLRDPAMACERMKEFLNQS